MNGRLTFLKKKKLSSTIFLFYFEADCFISYTAGQFVTMKLGNIVRSYSFVTYSNGVYTFMIRIHQHGAGSKMLVNMHKGTTLEYYGPFGNFVFQASKTASRYILVSTGTGIGPFIAMQTSICQEVINSGAQLTFIHCIGEVEDNIAEEYCKDLIALKPSNHFLCVQSQEELECQYLNVVRSRLEKVLDNLNLNKQCILYLCGNPHMIHTVLGLYHDKVESIFFEKYS